MVKKLIIIALLWLLFCGFTDIEIVNAIFLAEGGYSATYLYGIQSIPYTDEADARRKCFNTVINNRFRYADYGYKKYKTYLAFLANRYCPKNKEEWLKNVLYFLKRGGKR